MLPLHLAFLDDPLSAGLVAFLFLCALVFFGAIRRAIVTNQVTRKIFLTGFAACAIPLSIVLFSLFPGPLDLTPEISATDDISGEYVIAKRSITLLDDGSYIATNFDGLEGGTWSHDGWRLELNGSDFSAARFVKRGDDFLIAPYFDPEFGRLGPTLKKR